VRGKKQPRLPRRLSRSQKRLILLLVVALLVIYRLWSWPRPSEPESLAEGEHIVTKVVDGDTFTVFPGVQVRLIGVNAPELLPEKGHSEPWAQEATDFLTDQFRSSSWRVRLQFDAVRKDRYRRFLAYGFVGDRFLNAELVRLGLAQYEPQYNYSATVKNVLRRAQEEAQRNRRGIWSAGKTRP